MSSGISSSRTCIQPKSLLQEVYDDIENCENMEYMWTQKTDSVAHTGVVIKFDHTPKISIDFGGIVKKVTTKAKVAVVGSSVASAGMSTSISPSSEENAGSLVRKITFDGRVTLKDFVSSQVNIKGVLVKLPLRTRAEKKKATKVFNEIKNIDVGNYQLMTNNCRHYVIAIATYLKDLPEFEEKQWKEFEEKMEEIMKKDNKKFKDSLSSCSYFLKQTILKHKKTKNDQNIEYEKVSSREETFS